MAGKKSVDWPSVVCGQKFGKWVVISEMPKDPKRTGRRWLCQCKCGLKKIKRVDQLQTSSSCYKCSANGRKKHGMVNSPTYYTWQSMLQRCHYTKHKFYKYYGEKGIAVCKRWHKFKNFLEDLGTRPEGKQLDRINNNLGYYKENCHWVTPKQNCANRNYTYYKNQTGIIYPAKQKSRNQKSSQLTIEQSLSSKQ